MIVSTYTIFYIRICILLYFFFSICFKNRVFSATPKYWLDGEMQTITLVMIVTNRISRQLYKIKALYLLKKIYIFSLWRRHEYYIWLIWSKFVAVEVVSTCDLMASWSCVSGKEWRLINSGSARLFQIEVAQPSSSPMWVTCFTSVGNPISTLISGSNSSLYTENRPCWFVIQCMLQSDTI